MNIAKFLEERNVEFELIPHCEVYEAQKMAQAIHVSGHEVAKTVLLRANGGYEFVVAVLPADQKVDLGLVSQMLGGSKLELAVEAEITKHCPDCEVGALPPFGSQYGMKTVLAEDLAKEEQIVFTGNTHHEAIRMNAEDFREIEEPLIGTTGKSS